MGSYNIYGDVSSYNVTITDKLDSSKKSSLSLDHFEPVVNLNGLSFNAGIQFNF